MLHLNDHKKTVVSDVAVLEFIVNFNIFIVGTIIIKTFTEQNERNIG